MKIKGGTKAERMEAYKHRQWEANARIRQQRKNHNRISMNKAFDEMKERSKRIDLSDAGSFMVIKNGDG